MFHGFYVEKSDRIHTKYRARIYTDGKRISNEEFPGSRAGWVHFGATRYEHFHDKIGLYKHLDHNDPERCRLYKARHGALGYQEIRGTPAWFSWNALW